MRCLTSRRSCAAAARPARSSSCWPAPEAYAQVERSAVVLFQNACVFDGQSDELTAPMNVLIEGNKIARIGETSAAPAGATIIDAAGRTLMPGLIDAHNMWRCRRYRSHFDLPHKDDTPAQFTERLGYAVIADSPDEVRRGVREQLLRAASHIRLMAGGGVASNYDPLDVAQYSEAGSALRLRRPTPGAPTSAYMLTRPRRSRPPSALVSSALNMASSPTRQARS